MLQVSGEVGRIGRQQNLAEDGSMGMGVRVDLDGLNSAFHMLTYLDTMNH